MKLNCNKLRYQLILLKFGNGDGFLGMFSITGKEVGPAFQYGIALS